MYKDQEHFVRGQKLKLIIIVIVLAILAINSLLTGAPFLR